MQASFANGLDGKKEGKKKLGVQSGSGKMGKGKNKTRNRGGELPLTLLFEPPSSSSSTSMSTLGETGNPLCAIFSDVDRELLDEIYATAGRDAEVAAAMLLEILPSQARLPDSRSGRGGGQESQSGGGGQDARSVRGRFCAN